MRGTTNSQRGTGGGGEKLVISLKTNQASHEDLIGAKFSVVINGNATEYTWQGASMTIRVSPMLSYAVEFGEVEGYAKPESVTHTAVAGNDRFVTGTYNTELVTVNVSTNEGEVSGYEVTIAKVNKYGDNNEYTQVEYIESTGIQYIDTGFKPNSNTRVVLSAYNLSDSSGWTFGTWESSKLNQFAFSCNGTYSFRYGTTNKSLSNVPIGEFYVDYNKNNYTINDVSGSFTAQTFESVHSMYLFAINANGSVSSGKYTGRIYSCKIYDNDILVRDYIPVIDSNGVAGLWDKVNNIFYSSISSAAFIAGDKIGEVIAIQTTPHASYKISYGVSYIVKASKVSEYNTPNKQLFIASKSSRIINIVYDELPFGVNVYDINGRIITSDLWDTENNINALGVAIITDKCRFVVAKEDIGSSGVYWGAYNTNITSLTNYNDAASAATDLDGVGNTSKIIATIGNTNDGARTGSVAGDCSAYTFLNGKNGYLGAAGEWAIVWQNKEAVNGILALIGGNSLATSTWTSTECNSQYAWVMHSNAVDYQGLYTNAKNIGSKSRAFLAID